MSRDVCNNMAYSILSDVQVSGIRHIVSGLALYGEVVVLYDRPRNDVI
jgi:hypothetical protein